ncbi:amidohydrolase family protein [Haliea sp. E1-2-M8]|uniref:N-acyl-D-amino-acid deacylase family protein n=1 Tax=Haliea sp. E1-2-M8 TaxID=3064706 RepID=UPI00271C9E4C|nr:amidohydrolase family protein [Haliea sp. E1-2-M8]MDO8863206.1 amidohydrolase family protein [Haliea sp. E1-2-M8]
MESTWNFWGLVLAPLLMLVGACSDQADQAHAAAAAVAEPKQYDLVLANGTVVDGTGSEAYPADLGIEGGRIVAIGKLDSAAAGQVIDVSGKVVAPGFIDVHSHADWALDDPSTASVEGFLRQGVTTSVYGVDGYLDLEHMQRYATLGEQGGMGTNFMAYIGHNAVRREVMELENREPDAAELQRMQDLVKAAMDFGAVGLSTGLMYLPGSYASTEEVVALAKVTAPYGGVYDSHVRDPAKNLLASHQECLDIGLAAGVDPHPGHIKAVGAGNFGKGPAIVRLVEAGIARGQNVTVDLYPYDGAATAPVIALLYPGDDERGKALRQRMAGIMRDEPAAGDTMEQLTQDLRQYWRDTAGQPEVLAQTRAITEEPPEGLYSWVEVVGYQSMRIVVSENEEYEGRMVVDLAEDLGVTPFELYRQLIVAEGDNAMVTLGAIQEDDIRIVMRQPWAMISSDGAEVDPEHPRGRGTFPRVLGRYVREWGVLDLEDAVHKMSGLPARYLKLTDRGVLREGAVADIVVFDPETVIDRATWAEPTLYAEGVEHVFINGDAALLHGAITEQRLGRFVPFAPETTP